MTADARGLEIRRGHDGWVVCVVDTTSFLGRVHRILGPFPTVWEACQAAAIQLDDSGGDLPTPPPPTNRLDRQRRGDAT